MSFLNIYSPHVELSAFRVLGLPPKNLGVVSKFVHSLGTLDIIFSLVKVKVKDVSFCFTKFTTVSFKLKLPFKRRLNLNCHVTRQDEIFLSSYSKHDRTEMLYYVTKKIPSVSSLYIFLGKCMLFDINFLY